MEASQENTVSVATHGEQRLGLVDGTAFDEVELHGFDEEDHLRLDVTARFRLVCALSDVLTHVRQQHLRRTVANYNKPLPSTHSLKGRFHE